MSTPLITQLNRTSPSSFTDDAERLNTIVAAKALIARLYTPMERIEDLVSSQLPLVADLKIFADLEVFSKWQANNEGNPVDPETLGGWVGCSANLLRRLMRHLVVENVLKEIGEDLFAMTPFAVSLQSKDMSCWADYTYDFPLPTIAALPDFLKSTGYEEPTDAANGPFQAAMDCSGTKVFDYYRTRPREQATFNMCMASYASKRAPWLSFFPVKEELLAGSKPDAPFLVDVGGNVGHDLQKVFDIAPDLGERLVLQDLPEVIASAVCDPSIKRMGHDFFTPQPVQGARAYYLHSVLHDWHDDQAQKILENLKLALTPGYSKILINENVLTTRNPQPQMVMFDMVMLGVAAKERSEADWRKVIEAAGLKMSKVWSSPVARESIIEVGLP